ncbi:MAG TPA: response regulator [Holophagaceae bacterium]|jgi:CheY-like chemotaxis protein|nr:response regulator [Holophagaceae bacterium]
MAEGTLLIVDDDPALREALAAVLEQGGYATQQAGDGEEGLKRLKDEPDAFDGVLLDWKMPRMDGLTMLRHIKADPRTAPLPVIFQTGSGDAQTLRDSLAAGAHYFLTKPVRRQELLATVYTAVQGRRRQRELWGHVRDSARTLSLMDLGRFRYRTQEEAENLTYLLAAACPDPDRAAVGLAELLINAVEHGNLEITYEETTAAIEHRNRVELIRARLEDPRFAGRFAELRFEHLPDRYRFLVTDQGPGFDWKRFLQLSPDRAYDSHGRGVYMASNCFDHLQYMGKGNAVTAEILLPEGWPRI